MPLSCSSAGTPRSGRAQQLLPSAIIPSILTRMGSESALPRATSRSTRSSEITSGTPGRTPFSSTTSIFRLAKVGLPLDRLAGPDKGAGGGNPTQGLDLLRTGQTLHYLGIIDVGHLDGDILKSYLSQDALVLFLLQGTSDATRSQPHRAQHRPREVPLAAQEDRIRDGEPAAGLEDPEGLGDRLGLVRGEVDDAELEITTSTCSSGNGMSSMWPLRNFMFSTPAFFWF